MIDWRPIETAPKDGRMVLVYARDGYYFLAYFTEHMDQSNYDHWTHWAPLTPPEGK